MSQVKNELGKFLQQKFFHNFFSLSNFYGAFFMIFLRSLADHLNFNLIQENHC